MKIFRENYSGIKIGDKVYQDYLPKIAFDDDALEEKLREIENSQTDFDIFFSTRKIEYRKIKNENITKINWGIDEKGKREYFFDYNELPGPWISSHKDEKIYHRNVYGLLLDSLDQFIADQYFLSGTAGNPIYVYDTELIDSKIGILTNKSCLLQEIPLTIPRVFQFAVNCNKRAFNYAEEAAIKEEHIEMMEVLEELFIPITEYYQFEIEEFRNASRKKNFMESIKSIPRFPDYLSDNYRNFSQKFSKYDDFVVNTSMKPATSQSFEMALALTFLALNSFDLIRLLQQPAGWASVECSKAFKRDLLNEGFEIPYYFGKDKNNLLKAHRVFLAGRKFELNKQVKNLGSVTFGGG